MVYAEGEIVGGDGDDGQIGGEKYAKLIATSLDDKVKAIVLRVNSPGGIALASDVMWRELVLAKKDKPLVVSWGDAFWWLLYDLCWAIEYLHSPIPLQVQLVFLV